MDTEDQAAGGVVVMHAAVLSGDTVIRDVGPSTWITLGSLYFDRFYQDAVLWEVQVASTRVGASASGGSNKQGTGLTTARKPRNRVGASFDGGAERVVKMTERLESCSINRYICATRL